MKTLAIILTLISMYILSGCSLPPSTPFRASQSPSLKSRQQWVTMHSSINPIYKQAILEGALIAGMTKAMVRESWGNPCTSCYGVIQTNEGSTWIYVLYVSPTFETINATIFFNVKGYVIDYIIPQ